MRDRKKRTYAICEKQSSNRPFHFALFRLLLVRIDSNTRTYTPYTVQYIDMHAIHTLNIVIFMLFRLSYAYELCLFFRSLLRIIGCPGVICFDFEKHKQINAMNTRKKRAPDTINLDILSMPQHQRFVALQKCWTYYIPSIKRSNHVVESIWRITFPTRIFWSIFDSFRFDIIEIIIATISGLLGHTFDVIILCSVYSFPQYHMNTMQSNSICSCLFTQLNQRRSHE